MADRLTTEELIAALKDERSAVIAEIIAEHARYKAALEQAESCYSPLECAFYHECRKALEGGK